jgi:hypothetical protein
MTCDADWWGGGVTLCKRPYLMHRTGPSLVRQPCDNIKPELASSDPAPSMLPAKVSRPSVISTSLRTYSSTLHIRVTPLSDRMMASSAQASTRSNSSEAFIYGTAWKKEQTKDLVKQALSSGFRKIDTAAQPRHYQEALVGEAIREAINEGIVTREGIYVSAETINGHINSHLKIWWLSSNEQS